jgi:sensor histidine kinase YesM
MDQARLLKRQSAWSTVHNVLGNAPARVRHTAWFGLAGWIGLIALQALDSSDIPGVFRIAEFASAVIGATGGLLLGLVALLQSAVERHTTDDLSERTDEKRRVLLVLPVIALAAGMLLSVAITLMVVRAFLGTPAPFVAVVITTYVVIIWLAATIVLRTTRTLYLHASVEAGAAERAKAEAAEAQFAALQARMNPHFLFNALNTLAGLVRRDPIAAERTTENLSTVLRMTLDRSLCAVSTVGEEVEYVRAYLALEQARWGERLRVDWDIAPSAAGLPLLPLVLQPLIENALRHGLGAKSEGGTIRVAILVKGERIELSVEDDGAGFPPVLAERTGLGNLRRRLSSLYGRRSSLEIHRDGPGARVVVTVPLSPSPDADPGR